MKRVFKVIVLFFLLVGISVFLANYRINTVSKNKLYDSVDTIPYNNVGLVLGTSKYLRNGQVNLYYAYRINATLALYNAGKISRVLVSGDNGSIAYDEPTTFKEDLIRGGIPEDCIYLDYAGFRTLDSMVRAQSVFGQTSLTVISQKFHNQRAVFIAHQIGLDAIGMNARNVSGRYGFKTNIREKLARVKVFVDLIFGVTPKFLGPKVDVK